MSAAGRFSARNHRGRPVSLLGGPALAAAATAGACAAAGPTPRGPAAAALLAGLGVGALGLYDDLAGGPHARGLRGHLRALRAGELTTGAVKLGGIAALATAAARLARPKGAAVDLVVDAGLVAGGANLLNLLDVRPGRALKGALLAGGGLLATGAGPARRAAGPTAAAAALLLPDLRERVMIGDTGANALGALLGLAVAATPSRRVRLAVLAGVGGATALSEVRSFSVLIDATPPLRALDRLGRLDRPQHG